MSSMNATRLGERAASAGMPQEIVASFPTCTQSWEMLADETARRPHGFDVPTPTLPVFVTTKCVAVEAPPAEVEAIAKSVG